MQTWEYSDRAYQMYQQEKIEVAALHNAQEVLELLIESYQAEGRTLSQPQTLQAA